MTKKRKKRKRKGKENYLLIIDEIRQGLQKVFPQVNENLVDPFESLPHVLAYIIYINYYMVYLLFYSIAAMGKSIPRS